MALQTASKSAFIVGGQLPGPVRSAQKYCSYANVCAVRACAVAGTTYLVGSGPAGLDNLTMRASRLVSSADVLVVDAVR
jgi:hypothetical protein